MRKWQEGNRANQETIEGSFDANGYPHGHCKIIITGLRSEEVQADLDYGSIVRKYSARRTSGQEDYSQGYNSQSCNCIFQNGDETHGYKGQRADQICVIRGHIHQTDFYPMGKCECFYYNGIHRTIMFDMHGNLNTIIANDLHYGMSQLFRFVAEDDPEKEIKVEMQPAEESSTVAGQEQDVTKQKTMVLKNPEQSVTIQFYFNYYDFVEFTGKIKNMKGLLITSDGQATLTQIQQFKTVTSKGNIEGGYLQGQGERRLDNEIVESGNFIKGKLNGTGSVENLVNGTKEAGRYKDGVLRRSTDK